MNVVGKDLATVFGCKTEGDECGLEVALLQIFTGSLVAAETEGVSEAAKTITAAITNVRFIMAK